MSLVSSSSQDYVAAGGDISVNHMAVVALLGSTPLLVRYMSQTKKGVSDDPRWLSCCAPKRGKGQDVTAFKVERLRVLKGLLQATATGMAYLAHGKPIHMAIEDYAYGAKGRGIYQIAEVGGQARLSFGGVAKLRLHDPDTVKLFAAGKGNASKDEVIDAMVEDYGHRWLLDVPRFDSDDVRSDVADATALAEMVRVEMELRSGRARLSDYGDNVRRVFERVTKANPTKLLEREWA